MVGELEKGRLWNLFALRPVGWFQGWLGITNYPEEHFEDELQQLVNNPPSSVWRGQRQETVKNLFTVLLFVEIKDAKLKPFVCTQGTFHHFLLCRNILNLDKDVFHVVFIALSFSKHYYAPFHNNPPSPLECFLPLANLNLASVAYS